MTTTERLLQALEGLATNRGLTLTISGRTVRIGLHAYDFSYCSWEEGLFDAYIHISARYLAEEMTK